MENTGLRKIVEPTSREERVGGNGKKTEMEEQTEIDYDTRKL